MVGLHHQQIGVGIGRCRRKSEENFFGRSDVGKVGNFTDSTDRTSLPTPTDTGKSVTVSVVEVGLGWAEIPMSKPRSLT
jgi:hypothetical protein